MVAAYSPVPIAPEWREDWRVEDLLARVGAAWEYVRNITIGDIDQRASLARQPRLSRQGRLDTTLVQSYIENMLAGDTFPAIVVVRRDTDGRYEMLGGNHRIPAAVAAGRRKVDAYLMLTTDPKVIASVMAQLNEVEGRRTEDPNEIVERALEWAEAYGQGTEEAAREFRLKPEVLRRMAYRRKIGRRLANLNIRPDGLLPSHQDPLGRLINDNVLAGAVASIRTHGLNGPETEALVRAALEVSTEAAQIDAIAAFTSDPSFVRRRAEVAKGIRRGRTDYSRLVDAMQTITRVAERHASLEAMGAYSRQIPEFLQRRDQMIRMVSKF